MSSKSKILQTKKRQDKIPIEPNEVRIGSMGRIKNQISYAANLLIQKNHDQIVIKATGNAIAKSISVAEVLKRRIKGLYQNLTITSLAIREEQNPKEYGLDPVQVDRMTTNINLTLSRIPLDKTSYGYQDPINDEQVDELSLKDITDTRKKNRTSGPSRRTKRGRSRTVVSTTGRARRGGQRYNQKLRDDNQDYEDYNHDQRGNQQRGDNKNRGQSGRNYDEKQSRENQSTQYQKGYNKDQRNNQIDDQRDRQNQTNQYNKQNYDNQQSSYDNQYDNSRSNNSRQSRGAKYNVNNNQNRRNY